MNTIEFDEFDEFDIIVLNELLKKQIAIKNQKRPTLQLEIPEYNPNLKKDKEVKVEPSRVIVIDL